MTKCHLESSSLRATLLAPSPPEHSPHSQRAPPAARPWWHIGPKAPMPEQLWLYPGVLQLNFLPPLARPTALLSTRARGHTHTHLMRSHRQSSGADTTAETTTVSCTTHKPSGWRAASGACYAISCFGVSDPGDRMQSAVGLLQCGKPREETKSPMPTANGGPLSSAAMPGGHQQPWKMSPWPAADQAAPPQRE